MLDRLFVYGTLRKAQDGSLHPFLRGQAVFMDLATIPGELFHVAGYPGAVLAPVNILHVIHGEIYRLLRPEFTLRQLDEYEECAEHCPKPHEYQRRALSVTRLNGKSMPAWVYLYQRQTAGLRRIEGGDYFAFLPPNHQRV